jgi:hypothetical protein
MIEENVILRMDCLPSFDRVYVARPPGTAFLEIIYKETSGPFKNEDVVT